MAGNGSRAQRGNGERRYPLTRESPDGGASDAVRRRGFAVAGRFGDSLLILWHDDHVDVNRHDAGAFREL
jgi:hypothetical protein